MTPDSDENVTLREFLEAATTALRREIDHMAQMDAKFEAVTRTMESRFGDVAKGDGERDKRIGLLERTASSFKGTVTASIAAAGVIAFVVSVALRLLKVGP
jgi:hypothetical protein